MYGNEDSIDNIPRLHFWQDALAACTRQSIALLRMARQPVTHENILAVIASVPRSKRELADERWRDGYCSQTLKTAFQFAKDSPAFQELSEYFLADFTERHTAAQDLLIDSFRAILGTIGREEGVWIGPVADDIPDRLRCPTCGLGFRANRPAGDDRPRKGLITWFKRSMRRGR